MRSVVNVLTSSKRTVNERGERDIRASHRRRRIGLTCLMASVSMVFMLSALSGHAVYAAEKSEESSGGDAEAGKQKSATCQACHGTDGHGISPEFPNLAGQVPGHIAQQLASYKSTDPNSRNNAIMLGMVAALSEQDMADLDAYYSSLEAKPGFVSEEEVDEAKKGARLFRGGSADMQIPACMSCHGPAGKGVPPQYPRLAGQSVAYLEAQLLAFKNGERKHAMMNPIAFKLSAEQMRQVSLFIRGLN